MAMALSTVMTAPRWTHVAIPVSDLKRSIAFYTAVTPLVVVDERDEGDSAAAWLSNDGQVESPFVLVLAEFRGALAERFKMAPGKPIPTLAPFAHIGIEMPTKEEVDAASELGEKMGVLRAAAHMRPPPVGYICSLFDPDGNIIEFSWDQKVYSTIRALWGDKMGDAT